MRTKTVRSSVMTMLTVVLALGGVAAGCKKSEPAGAPAPATAEPGAAKTYHFAFVTNNSSDFWNIAEKGVRKAEKDLGIKAEVFRPLKTEVSEQQRFIEDILVQNFDGMAICAINPDAMTPLLDRVAAKMPVVVHDSDAPKSQRKAFVGTDNVAAGRLAGQAAIDALKAANITKGKVAMFVGPHRHAELDRPQARHRRDAGQAAGHRDPARVPRRRRPQQGEEERRGRAGAVPRPGDDDRPRGRTTARAWSTPSRRRRARRSR